MAPPSTPARKLEAWALSSTHHAFYDLALPVSPLLQALYTPTKWNFLMFSEGAMLSPYHCSNIFFYLPCPSQSFLYIFNCHFNLLCQHFWAAFPDHPQPEVTFSSSLSFSAQSIAHIHWEDCFISASPSHPPYLCVSPWRAQTVPFMSVGICIYV